MPGADRQFTIKIVSQAENEGISQAKDGLKGVKDAAQQVVPAQEDASRAADKSAISHKQMHQAMHLIKETAPEVGFAIQGMASGPAAAFGALLFAVGRLKADLANLKDSLSTAEFETYSGVVDQLKQGLRDASLQANSFEREISRAATATKTAADNAKELNDIEHQKLEAADAVAQARKNLELEQSKRIEDPVTRAQKVLEIETRYASEKKQRDDLAAQNELGRKREAIAAEEDAADSLTKKLADARLKLSGLGMTEGSVNKQVDTEKNRLAAITADLEKKQSRLQEIPAGWAMRSTPQEHERDALLEQIPSLEEQQKQQRGIVATLEAQRAGKLDTIKAADEEVKALEQQLQATRKRAKELRDNLPLDEQRAEIASGQRADVGALTTQTKQAEFTKSVLDSDEGKRFKGAATAENILLHGGKISSTQEASLRAVENMLKAAHMNGQAILQALAQSARNDEALARQIAEITKKMASAHNP